MMLVKNEMTKNKKKYVHEMIFPKKKKITFFSIFQDFKFSLQKNNYLNFAYYF